MSLWSRLEAEGDAALAGRRVLEFWWRDDDACRDSAALQQLFDLSEQVPLALATIPDGVDESLREALRSRHDTVVWQHGLSHRSHAPEGEKKAEFGPHRPLETMLADIAAGQALLQARLGDRLRPVFVPPWNRIDPRLVEVLPKTGVRALSCFADKPLPLPPGLGRADCHIDLIDWRGHRGFVGESALLTMLENHLRESRRRLPDANIRIGIMSHHLDHDRATWSFLADLVRFVQEHPGAVWLSPDELINVTS